MDDVIEAIRALIDTADVSNTYKKIFYGQNKMPSQAKFPFIEVIPNGTTVENKTTCGGIESTYQITINIKDTLKNFLTSDTNKEVIAATKAMVKKMEERDANGTPKTTTILGILIENLQLSSTVHINDDWEIIYDESELAGSWILIASISFTAKRLTP